MSNKGIDLECVHVEDGEEIIWGEETFYVAQVHDGTVSLAGSESGKRVLSIESFRELVADGSLEPADSGNDNERDRQIKTSIADEQSERSTAEANARYAAVKPFVHDDLSADEATTRYKEYWERLLNCSNRRHYAQQKESFEVSTRSIYRWAKAFRKARANYGSGILGLYPDYDARGSGSSLDPTERRIIEEKIDRYYLQKDGKTIPHVVGLIKRECIEEEEYARDEVVSGRTVRNFISKLDPQKVKRVREGDIPASSYQPFSDSADEPIPDGGDYPLDDAHFDHTQLDVQLVDPVTDEPLGRPWISALMDVFSRRILAVYVSFDPPSRVSHMMALRTCVERFNCLPRTIVYDNERPSGSEYVQQLLGMEEVHIRYRPPYQPQMGAKIERWFRTLNSKVIHNLEGNTTTMTNPRQVKEEERPKYRALLTLEELTEMIETYAYELYDKDGHSGLDPV